MEINKNKNDKRFSYSIFCVIFTLVINVFLSTSKLIIGFLSSSISIIADGLNNLVDIFVSILSLVAIKLSFKPADEEHPYGHERIEYILTLIISIIIIFFGVNIMISSIESFFSTQSVTYSFFTLVVLLISIILKFIIHFINKFIGRKINSSALIATSKDSLMDCVSTFSIIISIMLFYFFNINVDWIIGLVVSIFIIINGFKLIINAIDLLIGKQLDDEIVDCIVNDVLANINILSVHDVIAHSYGKSNVFMSMHVEVDSQNSLVFIHNIIDEIEREINNEYNINLVIHIDPVDLTCEETLEFKRKVKDILKGISNDLDFHDFRVKKTNNLNILIFDIVKPYDFKYNNAEIEDIIQMSFDNKIQFKITYDFKK